MYQGLDPHPSDSAMVAPSIDMLSDRDKAPTAREQGAKNAPSLENGKDGKTPAGNDIYIYMMIYIYHIQICIYIYTYMICIYI